MRKNCRKAYRRARNLFLLFRNTKGRNLQKKNGKVVGYTGDPRTLFELQNQKVC